MNTGQVVIHSEKVKEARNKLFYEIGRYGVSENKGLTTELEAAAENLINTSFGDGMDFQREGDKYYDNADKWEGVVGEVTVVTHDGMSDFPGDKNDPVKIVTRYEQFKCETWIPEGTYLLVRKENA